MGGDASRAGARPLRSIARRIAILFSFLLVVFVLASAFALFALDRMNQAMVAIERDAARMRAALKLGGTVRDQYAHMAHTIILGNDSHVPMYDDASMAVQVTAAEVLARVSDPDARGLIAEVRAACEALDAIFRDELLPAIRNHAAVPADLHPRILDQVDRAQTAAERLSAARERSILGIGAQARALHQTAMRLSLVCLLTAVVCAIGAAVYLHRSVARPVAKLAAGVARIAAGNLDTKLDVKRKDELGRLADQFNVMAAALTENQARLVHNETLAGLGRMAAGIAHEINNPLAVILGYVKVLRRRSGSPASAELETIELEAERCREIVEDLLDLTRKAPLTHEDVDLRRLCEEVVDRLRHSGDEAGLHITVTGDAHVVTNRKKILQVIHNLVRNAIEAGGDQGRINIVIARISDGRVAITTSDNGPGVRADDRKNIFEPFFTTKPSGTGLGLAVSRAVARACGGDLELLAVQEPGAVFRLTLPDRQPEVA